ncbi:hypothetical protein COO60DRAFT_1547785 [Scenedesmus sp. NREL 46B-D3]|nr:hypothetical protein COO60DRAFT_1547785 [Scenedesmus sp. NREL 46B-D3]
MHACMLIMGGTTARINCNSACGLLLCMAVVIGSLWAACTHVKKKKHSQAAAKACAQHACCTNVCVADTSMVRAVHGECAGWNLLLCVRDPCDASTWCSGTGAWALVPSTAAASWQWPWRDFIVSSLLIQVPAQHRCKQVQVTAEPASLTDASAALQEGGRVTLLRFLAGLRVLLLVTAEAPKDNVAAATASCNLIIYLIAERTS